MEQAVLTALMSSWRHTPFRNAAVVTFFLPSGSWRHTPFRKCKVFGKQTQDGSWRHTPFRKCGNIFFQLQ